MQQPAVSANAGSKQWYCCIVAWCCFPESSCSIGLSTPCPAVEQFHRLLTSLLKRNINRPGTPSAAHVGLHRSADTPPTHRWAPPRHWCHRCMLTWSRCQTARWRCSSGCSRSLASYPSKHQAVREVGWGADGGQAMGPSRQTADGERPGQAANLLK
jgi:hypothetical protein